jgi:phosphoribosylpyrophosphate synthetase
MTIAMGERIEADRAKQRTPAAPVVVVLRGHDRFVSRLSRAAFARVAVKRFANGELYARLPEPIVGRSCILVGSISPPAGNLERFTLVAHALRHAGARRATGLLPYFAYARQDRAPPGESLGLAWVGGLLRASGVDHIVCVDVHSQQASEVLGLRLASLSPAAVLAGALPGALARAALRRRAGGLDHRDRGLAAPTETGAHRVSRTAAGTGARNKLRLRTL